MHREHVTERVKSCTYDDLKDWKNHVLFCLKWYKKDNNKHEIDECEFLLKQIEGQMAYIKANDRLS